MKQSLEMVQVLISDTVLSFHLKKSSILSEDGISIPSKYTSSLAPLQSAKLFNEIRGCREKDKHHLHHLETPYVVYLHNKWEIAPSQELFTFHHPNRSAWPSGAFVHRQAPD